MKARNAALVRVDAAPRSRRRSTSCRRERGGAARGAARSAPAGPAPAARRGEAGRGERAGRTGRARPEAPETDRSFAWFLRWKCRGLTRRGARRKSAPIARNGDRAASVESPVMTKVLLPLAVVALFALPASAQPGPGVLPPRRPSPPSPAPPGGPGFGPGADGRSPAAPTPAAAKPPAPRRLRRGGRREGRRRRRRGEGEEGEEARPRDARRELVRLVPGPRPHLHEGREGRRRRSRSRTSP